MFDDESLARIHRDFERFAEGNDEVSLGIQQDHGHARIPSAHSRVACLRCSTQMGARRSTIANSSLAGTAVREPVDTLARLVFKMFDLSGSGNISKLNLLTILSGAAGCTVVASRRK